MLMPAPDPGVLARREQLIARLREVVPDGVIDDETSRRAYEQDALTAVLEQFVRWPAERR